LGEEIASLPSTQISALALPEKLENAIREIIKMPHKAARKRQLKFIAQQFYKMDNLEPILEKVAKFTNKSSHAVREHHIVESWRDRLLGEHHDEALTDLLNEKPHADRQHLRQLVRNAQKEIVANKPAKSPKLLYRYLKTLFEDDELDDFEEHALETINGASDMDFEDDFEDDDEYDD
jgi:ribosome-associated protein